MCVFPVACANVYIQTVPGYTVYSSVEFQPSSRSMIYSNIGDRVILCICDIQMNTLKHVYQRFDLPVLYIKLLSIIFNTQMQKRDGHWSHSSALLLVTAFTLAHTPWVRVRAVLAYG